MPRKLSQQEVAAIGDAGDDGKPITPPAPPNTFGERMEAEQNKPRKLTADEAKAAGLTNSVIAEPPSMIGSLARGLRHGGSLGWDTVDAGARKALGVPEVADAAGLPGALVGAGAGLVQRLMRGGDGPSIIDDYRSGRDALKDQLGADKRFNPATTKIGQTTGGIAASLIPGGAAANGLGGALKAGGALGAIAGLGESDADLTRGEWEKGAADTALGAATGAGGAVAGYGLAKGIGAAAPSLNRFANKAAVKAMRPTARDYELLGKDGVQRIGAAIRPEVSAFSTPAAITARVTRAREAAGAGVGDAARGMDADADANFLRQWAAGGSNAQPTPAAGPQVIDVRRSIGKLTNDTDKFSPPQDALRSSYFNDQNALAGRSRYTKFGGGSDADRLTFEETAKLRRDYQNVARKAFANPDPARNSQGEASEAVAGAIMNSEEEAARRAVISGAVQPQSFDAYAAAKAKFGPLKDAEKMGIRASTQDEARAGIVPQLSKMLFQRVPSTASAAAGSLSGRFAATGANATALGAATGAEAAQANQRARRESILTEWLKQRGRPTGPADIQAADHLIRLNPGVMEQH